MSRRLWDEASASRPFLSLYTADERGRLREKVVLFLHAKGIVGAQGHEVTPLQRVGHRARSLRARARARHGVLRRFENVIVYPGEFVPDWEWEDEAGVVHRNDEPMAGEAMPGGPVVLSWPDVAAGADWQATGMNLVIHEFAHKIDMRNGEADGCPPLPAGMSIEPGRAR
jgi:Mlc titration factor MtfA (ptsG expression regulator)